MAYDVFKDVHSLLERGGEEEAVQRLFCRRTGRIKAPYNKDLNHAWYLVGNVYLERNDYEMAISCFKRSIDNWPEDVEAIWALAYCYSEMELPRKAREWLKKAIKIDPDNFSILYNYGNALFDLKKYNEAYEVYRKIPKDSDVFVLAKKNMRRIRGQ